MSEQELVTIGFTCASDASESKEKDVPISNQCNLVGTRQVIVNKLFTHRIQIALKSVITVVYNADKGWYMADADGRYDLKWYMSGNHLELQNVKFMQGLVIRGALESVRFHSKKYCKKLEYNLDGFFCKDHIPVMTAQKIYIYSDWTIWGRGW